MSQTVFIFGAGASKQAGVPLMGEFFDVARRIRPLIKGEIADEFDRVFLGISALQVAHSKADIDLDNLESVFATFEMARLFGTNSSATPRPRQQAPHP
jgi:hypothetical protein